MQNNITIKTHKNGLKYLDIKTPQCKAKIFLHGAQITSFIPNDRPDLLWVSEENTYQPGTSIRGGIPICWPWFGPHQDSKKPQHGYARNQLWELNSISYDADTLCITMYLPNTKKLLNQDLNLEIIFKLSTELQIELINRNNSDETIQVTQALHSYFPVSDIKKVKINGLKGAEYFEFGKGPTSDHEDFVQINNETDRSYQKVNEQQTILDESREIIISRINSKSVVLWNPWIEKSKSLSNFSSIDYKKMICLEAANILDDKIILEPNQTHKLILTIKEN